MESIFFFEDSFETHHQNFDREKVFSSPISQNNDNKSRADSTKNEVYSTLATNVEDAREMPVRFLQTEFPEEEL